jgi:hypothetical protein
MDGDRRRLSTSMTGSDRHGRACPGHPPPDRTCADGRDKPGHDGESEAGRHE